MLDFERKAARRLSTSADFALVMGFLTQQASEALLATDPFNAADLQRCSLFHMALRHVAATVEELAASTDEGY